MPRGAAGAGGWYCGTGGNKRKREEGPKDKETGRSEEGEKEGNGRINNYGLLHTASHCTECFANLISVLTIAL